VDDHSRLAYVETLPDERGDTTTAFLRRAVRWFRRQGIRIERVMSDNGSGYLAGAFAGACRELGLRHLRTRPYTPRTNGKAERFIQTLLREWAYARPYRTSHQRTKQLDPWLRHDTRRRPARGPARASPSQPDPGLDSWASQAPHRGRGRTLRRRSRGVRRARGMVPARGPRLRVPRAGGLAGASRSAHVPLDTRHNIALFYRRVAP
jgi:hypothetical protein